MSYTAWLTGAFAIVATMALPHTAQTQILKKIGKKLEQKAEEAAEKATDKVLGTESSDGGSGSSPSTTSKPGGGPFKDLPIMVYDFTPGNQTIFFDDFSNEAIGGMAGRWTSNGTGAVETVDGVNGKWLKLFDKNTYKIKELVAIPENFTLEFDILTRAESKSGIDLDFGFDYEKGIGGHKYLAYRNPINVRASYNFNSFTFTSTEMYPKKNSDINANMAYFVNDVMKVKIRVDGTRMRAYINEYKVLDTDMADPKTKKYFYLAANTNENRSGVYLGNFRIAGISGTELVEDSQQANPRMGSPASDTR